jgi:hypothetical protein
MYSTGNIADSLGSLYDYLSKENISCKIIINLHPFAVYPGLSPVKLYISWINQTLLENFAAMDSNLHNVKGIKSMTKLKVLQILATPEQAPKITRSEY